jgi:hypothetical protein
VNCWDTFTFNNSTCTWDNDGTAKPNKEKSELLGYFTFNNSTCTWDNDGTANNHSRKSELLGYFTFNNLLVLGIMMEQLNLMSQQK